MSNGNDANALRVEFGLPELDRNDIISDEEAGRCSVHLGMGAGDPDPWTDPRFGPEPQPGCFAAGGPFRCGVGGCSGGYTAPQLGGR